MNTGFKLKLDIQNNKVRELESTSLLLASI